MATTSIRATTGWDGISSSASIGTGGTYADVNVDGGSTVYNYTSIGNVSSVGQYKDANFYIVYQSLIKFDLSSLPIGDITTATLTLYTNSLVDNTGYTVEVRETTPFMYSSCSNCAPVAHFYKGSNIVSNTGAILASIDSSAISSSYLGANALTSTSDLLTAIAPGKTLYLHVSSSANRTETTPTAIDRFSYLSLSGYKPKLDITYTPYSQNELGFNF